MDKPCDKLNGVCDAYPVCICGRAYKEQEMLRRRKELDDRLYALVKNANVDLYTKVVAATAVIGANYKDERNAAGHADYICERTIMGLLAEALGLH